MARKIDIFRLNTYETNYEISYLCKLSNDLTLILAVVTTQQYLCSMTPTFVVDRD